MEIDKAIDAAFEPVSNAVASVIFFSVSAMELDIKLILVWLVAAGLFFYAVPRFREHPLFQSCLPVVTR